MSIVSTPHAGRLEGGSDRPKFQAIRPASALGNLPNPWLTAVPQFPPVPAPAPSGSAPILPSPLFLLPSPPLAATALPRTCYGPTTVSLPC